MHGETVKDVGNCVLHITCNIPNPTCIVKSGYLQTKSQNLRGEKFLI